MTEPSEKKRRTDNNIPCPYEACTTTFETKSALKQHVDAVHLKLKPYKCNQCECAFSQKSNLTSHINDVHLGLKPYKCNQCEYVFSHKRDLTRHINNIHLGLKPYKCDQCECVFGQKFDLTTHINAVHLNLKPYSCDHCDEAFAHQSTLTSHINAVHLGLKSYKCDQCELAFSQKHDLTRHINAIHLKLKPYICDHCTSAFAFKNNLTTHINSVHLQQRPYSCDVQFCEAKYYRSDELKRHYERVHSERAIQRQKKEEEAVAKVLTESKIFYDREVQINFLCLDSTSPKQYARIDFVIETEQCIFNVECDENQHKDRLLSCETARMTRIFENITAVRGTEFAKPVCFVRFNPHAFQVDGVTQKMPKKQRYEKLISILNSYKPTKPMEILYMYYDMIDNIPLVFRDNDFPDVLKESVVLEDIVF